MKRMAGPCPPLRRSQCRPPRILLVAFPGVFASLADRMIGATAAWVTAFVVMILVGLYLTYVGWQPMPKGDQVHIDIEFPRAA